MMNITYQIKERREFQWERK